MRTFACKDTAMPDLVQWMSEVCDAEALASDATSSLPVVLRLRIDCNIFLIFSGT